MEYYWAGSREGYSSFSGCKEKCKELGKSPKAFSRDCFQQLLSFQVNTSHLNPLKFSGEGEEFTQKMSFYLVQAAGTCCCFPATPCTSQSQTRGTGTIRKKNALHGSHHGRAMEILNKVLSTFCLPNEMFKEQCSIGCGLLQIAAPTFAFLEKNTFSLCSGS